MTKSLFLPQSLHTLQRQPLSLLRVTTLTSLNQVHLSPISSLTRSSDCLKLWEEWWRGPHCKSVYTGRHQRRISGKGTTRTHCLICAFVVIAEGEGWTVEGGRWKDVEGRARLINGLHLFRLFTKEELRISNLAPVPLWWLLFPILESQRFDWHLVTTQPICCTHNKQHLSIFVVR